MRRLVLVLVFLGVWTLPAWALNQTFYVQSGASNNNCSTSITAPSGNLAVSVGCLGDNDTLFLRAGTYNCGGECPLPSGGSSESTRRTIAGYGPDGKWQVTLVGWFHPIGSSQGYITLQNFRLDAHGQTFAIKIDGHASGDLTHHITVDTLEIFGSNSHGIQMPGNQFGGNQTSGGNHKIVNNEIHHVSTDIRLEHGIYGCTESTLYDKN